MNNLIPFNDLHQYLSSFDITYTMAAKSLILSYQPRSFAYGVQPRFAALHGAKSYQCLILYVAPKNNTSTLGVEMQKKVEELLFFNLKEMRRFKVKNNEVVIPLEVIDTKEKLNSVKEVIAQVYRIRTKK